MQCGLLGRTLHHSYSPQIHKQLGNYCYALYETEPEALEAFLRNESFVGINVTIPYKKAVIPFCDDLSDRARKLGAVNTLVKRNGKLIGHNTDYFGFAYMVKKTGICVQGKKALVLGSGGASATVVAVLEEMGANVTVISRNGPDNYQNIVRHKDAAVIVNATPVGMFPETQNCPIDLDVFIHLEGVLDLIYNPANTRLLQAAQAKGIPCANGLWMLVAQAKESAEWFLQKNIPDAIIDTIYHKLRFDMENIVLVGMPGCGKSTVGQLLAQKLGRKFIDADAQIEALASKTIPEIFASGGEFEFRRLETQVLKELGKNSALVIATGGGCVTRQENYPHLHQNGKIIWLQREIEQLPTDGRPLSQKNKLADMYMIRKPMYEAFSDMVVSNNQSPEDTAEIILSQIAQEVSL